MHDRRAMERARPAYGRRYRSVRRKPNTTRATGEMIVPLPPLRADRFMSRRLGLSRLLPALACLAFAVCLSGPPSALASTFEFGTEGEGAGQFIEPTGIAIDAASGDVVLADTVNNRVEEFSSEGVFVRTWGWGVRDGKAEFEVCEASPCRAGLPGSGEGQFGKSGARGVAIDNSAGLTQGDMYVVDRENSRVDRFGPNGEFILSFGEAGEGPGQFHGLGENAVAVGPTGTVYVADIGRVQKFSAAGALEGSPIPLPSVGPSIGGIEGLLVDSVGDLYVLPEHEEGVRKFSGSGVELGSPRDPGVHGAEPSITLGPGDELLVSDGNEGRIFGYDPSGAQTLSLVVPDAEGARGGMVFGNGVLYVLYFSPPAVRLLSIPPPGPVILEGSEKAGSLFTTSATLEASINPEGPEETHYHFEYGTTIAYGTSVPEPDGELAPGFGDEPASAAVSALKPSTTYHFRVVAENALGQKAEGPDQTFQTLPPVSIESEAASQVSADSAKLSAELNPHGLPSTYHFEYGLTTAYGQHAPEPDGEAGEGTEATSFSIKIQHLSPNTTYHYRVVARNALNEAGEYVLGPDKTFTTQGEEPVALPDQRAWEMVSPPQKHGGSLEPIRKEGGTIQAALDGSGIAYVATAPVDEDPQGNRSAVLSELLATRSAPGAWSTQDITTPHREVDGVIPGVPSEYKLFSGDLSRGAVEPIGSTPLSPRPTEPSEPDAETTPYVREADGSFTPLVWKGNVPAGVKFGAGSGGTVVFVSATPDLSHVLFDSSSPLVAGFENEGFRSVYEWSEGTLSPVSVLPGGGAALGASVGNADSQVRNAISADGSRVFFSASSQLFVRDTNLGPSGETLRIDTPEEGVNEASPGALFQMASADGSKVFFTDGARLTTDATAKQGQPDLYECEIEVSGEELNCTLQDLSVDPHANEAAGVQGAVIGAGEDGRRVYFVSRGALGEGEEEARNGICPKVSEGQCVNLYEYDTEGESPQPRLVAVLSGEDRPDWFANGSAGQNLGEMTARVSTNGRYLAFMSKRSLSGYDNRDARSGALDEEVYEYDADTGRLACASCDPTGQRPAGEFDSGVAPGLLVDAPLLWEGQTLAGSIPGWTKVDGGHALHQSRYLSDSGRLFFNSPVGLLPGDGNGTQDVYDYEPQGVGSCKAAPACLGLISSGTSSEEASFLDASETGDDVFFLSAAQLSLKDTDTALDVYDAHVCSTAPGCAPPAVGTPPPCATTDSCRTAPTPQPGIFGAPASQTFSGSGNPTPEAPVKAKAKPLTRKQKLAKALKTCRTKHNKHKRHACEQAAQKRYGPLKQKRGTK
jgi:hypothetical protein